MMTIRRMMCVGLFLASSLLTAACGDDGGNVTVDAAKADAPPDMAGCVCDPVGALPGQSALLNATLATDVEVVTRATRHPGCAGPDGLP